MIIGNHQKRRNTRKNIRKGLKESIKNMRKLNKAVIFDLDGTLADSFDAHVYSFFLALKSLKIRVKLKDLKKFIGKLFGKKAIEISEEICKRYELEISPSKFLEIKRKFFRRSIEKVKKFKCAKNVLIRFKKNKYAIFVVSNSIERDIGLILRKVGIRRYIDKIYSTSRKDKTEIIEKISKRFEKIVAIDDYAENLKEFKKYGILVFGVRTGRSKKKDFENYGIKSFKDLCQLASYLKNIF